MPANPACVNTPGSEKLQSKHGTHPRNGKHVDRIEELGRIGPMPGFSVMHARNRRMDAMYELSVLRLRER